MKTSKIYAWLGYKGRQLRDEVQRLEYDVRSPITIRCLQLVADVASCPVYFDSAECSITFSNQYLSRRSQSADALLFDYLQHDAEALHKLQRHQLMDELPSVLVKALLNGESTARQVASAFGLHERTFHRRLSAAGTSFRAELDRARHLVSEQLLVGTELPVCDIAGALGYADSSGFIRAFRRWSGVSPSAWRERNRLQ